MYVENIKTAKIVIISACPHNCNKIRKKPFFSFFLSSLLLAFSLPYSIINDIRNSQNMYRRRSQRREGEKWFSMELLSFFCEKSHIQE